LQAETLEVVVHALCAKFEVSPGAEEERAVVREHGRQSSYVVAPRLRLGSSPVVTPSTRVLNCGDNDAHLGRINVFYHEALGGKCDADNPLNHTPGQKLGQRPLQKG
jgi:hypothetical protein